jgi:hypothetical protein
VTKALELDDAEALAQAVSDLDRKVAYLWDRHRVALGTLERLAPVQCPLADLLAEAERLSTHELAWAKGAIDLHAAALHLEDLPDLPAQPLSEAEKAAAALVPVRRVRGPIPLRDHLRRLDGADREAWRGLLKARKGGAHYTLTTLALYWADGARSVLEIADFVELEAGRRDVELLVSYFRLLEKLGIVIFR